MPVGQQSTDTQINGLLSLLSANMRNVCTQMKNLNEQINGGGNGLAYLESLGFSAADANSVIQYIGYFNTLSGVYFGTATQTPAFNFDNQLAALWAGNV